MRQHRPEFHTIIRLQSQTSRETSSKLYKLDYYWILSLSDVQVQVVSWCGVVWWCGEIRCGVCELPQITGAGSDEEEEGG